MVSMFFSSFSEFTDTLGEGAFHLLEGMAIVFAALAILWGAIELFRIVYTKLIKKEKKTDAPAPVTEPVPQEAFADESETVAAISAALAVYLDKPQSSFRVVSFKRKGGNSWNNR